MKKNKLLSTIPALCMMAGIFYFSAQNATKSSGLSGGIVSHIYGMIEENSGFKLATINSAAWLEAFETVIRKAAHMSEYALLALTVFFSFHVSGHRGKKIILWSEAVCVLYAMTDEFHQLFVPGRSGQITDVLIDGCGALIGCLIFNKLLAIRHKR